MPKLGSGGLAFGSPCRLRRHTLRGLRPAPRRLRSALARSWSVTAGNGFRLFVFYALLTIAYFVILMVVSVFAAGILGLAAASSTATMGSAIVSGLLGAGFSMIFSGVVVAIHRQLCGPDAVQVSETFE